MPLLIIDRNVSTFQPSELCRLFVRNAELTSISTDCHERVREIYVSGRS